MPEEKELVQLAVFLGASYVSGKFAEAVNVSPVVAFITIGALLGPPLANFAPVSAGLVLAGLLGIQLSVIDTGLGTELADLRKCAFRAFLVAVLGVIFPIAGAVLVLSVADALEGRFESSRSLRTAFAAGAAIAPTSLGVTARLLAEAGELDTPLGQLVSVAAIFDDVISLVLLSQVIAIAKEDPGAWLLAKPVVFSVVFILASLLATFLLPLAVRYGFKLCRVPESQISRIGLSILLLTATAATYLATIANTSFLLAGYVTGVAFAQIPEGMGKEPWKEHVQVHVEWLSMLFFAATIGFVIPIRDLFAVGSLGIGALLATVSVFGKVLCGLGLLPRVHDGIAIGVAMLGRGEFGFLIASQARAVGLLDDRIYAATTWGVVVPTLLSPLIVGPVFKWRRRRLSPSSLIQDGPSEPSCGQVTDSDPVEGMEQ